MGRLASHRVNQDPAHQLAVSLRQFPSKHAAWPRPLDESVSYESLGWADPTDPHGPLEGSKYFGFWRIDHPSLWVGYPMGPGSGHDGGKNLPEGHPQRCQMARRYTSPLRQCANKSTEGRCFCYVHDFVHRSEHNQYGKSQKITGIRKMTFYTKGAGPKLREILDRAVAAGDNRHSLAEEIDLARAITERSVRIFEIACFEKEDASPELKAAATQNLRTALTHVADLVHTAARVRVVDRSVLDAQQVEGFVNKLIAAVEDALPNDKALAERVVAAIRNVDVPRAGDKAGAMSPEKLADDTRKALEKMNSSVGAI